MDDPKCGLDGNARTLIREKFAGFPIETYEYLA